MKNLFSVKNLKYSDSIEYINYYLALIFVFIMPISKKLLPYVIGLWFLTWLLEGNYRKKFSGMKNKLLFFAAIAFYLYHVIGLLYSTNLKVATFDIQVKLTLLFAPLVMAGANKLYRLKFNEILLTFVIGNVVASLLCIINAFAKSLTFTDNKVIFNALLPDQQNRFFYGFFSIFQHPSYFAMYITFSIAIIAYFYLKGIYIKDRRWNILFIITVLLFFIMLILLSSKAGIIIGSLVIFISCVTIVINNFRKKAVYIIGILSLVFLLSAYYLVNHNLRFQILLNRINTEHINNPEKRDMRLDVWYSSIQVIQENFLFGVGAGDIKDNLYKKYEANNFHIGVERQYNSHQQFLETFIGQGIIGLFLLLLLLIIPFYKSIEEKNFLWFSFVFIVFFNFLFESMLNTIAGVTFFGFFYSLITFVPYIDISAKIPFSPPRIDHKIIHEVVDTLQSGWITTGPKTKRFENLIAEYCGCEKTLCVNSATSGLKLILRWYGVGPGDEVIVPAYTYSATANVVVQSGAKLVFVDINESDFNISVNEIEKAITNKTKVIIPVDFSGLPCDYDEINELVSNEKIKKLFHHDTDVQKELGRILILSDSAHSLGAEYKGRKSGNLTDISVFSFHAVKNLTTGEGGAICFNFKEAFDNKELYHQLNILSLHGQTKDAFQKSSNGNWKYDIIDAGYKSNMTDILASMGLVELERYEIDDLPKYRYIFDRYSKALKDKSWAVLPIYETLDKKSSYHIYPLRIKNIDEKTRDEIMQKIINENVAVNVHFMPVPMFTFYKKLGYSIENYKQAYKNYSCEITLPAFYNLSDAQIDRVIKVLNESVDFVLNKKGNNEAII